MTSRQEPWGRGSCIFLYPCTSSVSLRRVVVKSNSHSFGCWKAWFELAKPRFYLCLSCRFGDHAECRKGKCECECGSGAITPSLSTRDMGVERSKVVPAGSTTGTRVAGLSRSGPTVRRRRPLYTAAQLKLTLEGRSARQLLALDMVMRPEFLRRVEELQIQTQLIYAIFFGEST